MTFSKISKIAFHFVFLDSNVRREGHSVQRGLPVAQADLEPALGQGLTLDFLSFNLYLPSDGITGLCHHE